jgi:hypothetical protein
MLNISPEKVCYIIVKAREFDVKVPPVEPDPGSNPADGGEREILSDYADDPTLEELKGALGSLNEDEMIDLVALVWMGRGDYAADSWDDAVRMAGETVDKTVVGYLVGIPLLGDYLEEALSQLGHSCEEYEINRL